MTTPKVTFKRLFFYHVCMVSVPLLLHAIHSGLIPDPVGIRELDFLIVHVIACVWVLPWFIYGYKNKLIYFEVDADDDRGDS